jgi:hypothetical protein
MLCNGCGNGSGPQFHAHRIAKDGFQEVITPLTIKTSTSGQHLKQFYTLEASVYSLENQPWARIEMQGLCPICPNTLETQSDLERLPGVQFRGKRLVKTKLLKAADASLKP